MSALWRAELHNLQRLVRIHTEEPPQRPHATGHAGRTQAIKKAVSCKEANRETILRYVARLKKPESANKISEAVGLTDETVRKALRQLAEAGKVAEYIRNPGTGWKTYGPIAKT